MMSIRICFPLADEETRERERALSRRLLRNVNTSTVWFWIYIYTWREVKFQILEALFFPFFLLITVYTSFCFVLRVWNFIHNITNLVRTSFFFLGIS